MKNKSKSTPKSQDTILKSYIACCDGLANLLKKEITFLETNQIDMLEQIADQKDVFIARLQEIEKETRSYSKEKMPKDLSLLEKARASHERVQQLSLEVTIHLQSRIKVGNELVEVFKEKQRSQSANLLGYDKEGKSPSSKKLEKHTPAVNLSNKI